jgi:hypothetical protein
MPSSTKNLNKRAFTPEEVAKINAADRKRMKELEKELADLQDEKDHQAKKLKSQAKQLQEASTNNYAGSSRKLVLSEIPKHVKAKIKDAIKMSTWRLIKFYPAEEAEELVLGKKIFSHMVRAGTLPNMNPKNKKQRDAWVMANSAAISSEYNQHRNGVLAHLKDDCFKLYTTLKQNLPPVTDIHKCFTRNIDLTKSHERQLFKWYWETYLAHAVGNTRDWGKQVRRYGTISEATPENDPNFLYMTASNEAFAIVAYHNYRDAWIEQWKLKANIAAKFKAAGKDPTDISLVQANKQNEKAKKKAKEGDEYCVVGTVVYMYDKKFKGKWTEADAGSKKSGGWSELGHGAYLDYMKQAKQVREDPNKVAVEKAFLERLRKDFDINEATYAETQRMLRSKTSVKKAATPKVSAFATEMAEFQDSSEDEDDEQSESANNIWKRPSKKGTKSNLPRDEEEENENKDEDDGDSDDENGGGEEKYPL